MTKRISPADKLCANEPRSAAFRPKGLALTEDEEKPEIAARGIEAGGPRLQARVTKAHPEGRDQKRALTGHELPLENMEICDPAQPDHSLILRKPSSFSSARRPRIKASST